VKIEAVESYVAGDLHWVLVRTDTGLTGLGQSACWAYPAAVDAVIETFRSYLLGRDPFEIERHWYHLYRMGPFKGSVLSAAVSAIDIALWDIKARAAELPIWQLLGGRFRDKIRLHALIPRATGDALLGHISTALEQGFTAIKFVPLPEDHFDLSLHRLVAGVTEMTAAARELVGSDVDLILEFSRKLTALQAPAVLEAVAPFAPLFCEDPLQIDSIAAQAELAKQVRVPLGIGERIHTIWEFRELLAEGGPQYIRPDLGLAGGFSHCRKIAAVAESFNSIVVTHNAFGPVLTAASVHFDIVTPNVIVQEYWTNDESSMHSAFTNHVVRDGGFIHAPEVPGLGVELDPDRLDPSVFDNYMGGVVYQFPERNDGSVVTAV
jgi:galactonate dehydratase